MNICPKCSDQKKNIIHAYDYPECDGLRGGYELKNVEENKSWNEFIEWANELGETESKYFTYINCADYEKVGLLIQYLKSKGYVDKAEYSAYSSGVMFWDFRGTLALDRLEKLVKELKPKEDDEVEELAEELCKVTGNQFDEFMNQKEWWITVAKKAIEIIRGEK